MIPMYDTKRFTDIYDNDEDFLEEWKESGLYALNLVKDASIKVLFYLLYARHGNDPIANLDETQFKYKMWSNIYRFGPTWEKRLDIQEKLRALDLDSGELFSGSKAIHNHAYNPNTSPSTDSETALNYINEQNTSNLKKGKLEAYSQLWELLRMDVTTEFLSKFDSLFLTVVAPQRTAIYVTESEEGDEEE